MPMWQIGKARRSTNIAGIKLPNKLLRTWLVVGLCLAAGNAVSPGTLLSSEFSRWMLMTWLDLSIVTLAVAIALATWYADSTFALQLAIGLSTYAIAVGITSFALLSEGALKHQMISFASLVLVGFATFFLNTKILGQYTRN